MKLENVAAGVYLLLVCLVCIAAVLVAYHKVQERADLAQRVTALEGRENVPAIASPAPLIVRESVSSEQVTTIITTVEADLQLKWLNYAPTADCVAVSHPGDQVTTWNCKQR